MKAFTALLVLTMAAATNTMLLATGVFAESLHSNHDGMEKLDENKDEVMVKWATTRSLLNSHTPPRDSTCRSNGNFCSQPGSGGPTCCDGICTNLGSDNQNCGRCGRRCSFSRTCCNGDCVNLRSDRENCGRCNNVCPPKHSHSNSPGDCDDGMCEYNGKD